MIILTLEELEIKFLKRWIIAAVSLFLFSSSFSLAQAATMFLAPSSGTYDSGSNFSISVRVNSAGVSINAVEGVLIFNPNELAVTSLVKSGSIFSLWVQEPDFSNALGTINFGGIIFNPGFTGASGTLLTLNFKAKAVATSQVTFSSGAVLANDGQGTNILSSLGGGAYVLKTTTTVPRVTPVAVPISAPVPAGPLIITSTTHPDQNGWYSNNDPVFQFQLPSDARELNLVLSRNLKSTPQIKYAPPITEKVLEDVEEGVWYLHANYRGGSGLSQTIKYRFQVDASLPKNLEVVRIDPDDTTNPSPKFKIRADDSVSGIDHYEMKIGDGDWFKIEPEFGGKDYKLPLQAPGAREVIVKAFDQAGNFSQAGHRLETQSIERPTIDSIKKSVVKAGEAVIIAGRAKPFQKVKIMIRVNPEYTLETVADGSSYWKVEFRPEIKGRHEVSAQAIDERGAVSVLSDRVIFSVRSDSIPELIFDLLMNGFDGLVNFILSGWLFIIVTVFTGGLIYAIVKKAVPAIWREAKKISYIAREYHMDKKIKKRESKIRLEIRVISEDIRKELDLLKRIENHRNLRSDEQYLKNKLTRYLDLIKGMRG